MEQQAVKIADWGSNVFVKIPVSNSEGKVSYDLIHRLAQRWTLTNGKNVQQTEADLKKLCPREHWNALHLRIIFYGRQHCSAHACDGTVCEICRTVVPDRKRAVVTKK